MTEREAALLKRQLEAAREEVGSSRDELERAREELRKAEHRLTERDGEIERLKMKVQALMIRLFGASSEKLDPSELQMLLDGMTPADESGQAGKDGEEKKPRTKRRSRRKGRQPRFPENTRVVVETIIPDEVRNHPEDWEEVGKPECTELIDYIPEEFVVHRTLRPKFRHRDRRELPPLVAPAPAPPIPGAACTTALGAQLLYAKYVLHQPLYRQQSHFQIRHEVHLPRSTLTRWVFATAERLRPIGEAIALEVLAYKYQQTDETPHRYLEPGRGRTGEGRMWVHNVPIPSGPVCYRWHTNRSRRCLEDFYIDADTGELRVEGALTLQCDAYSAYASFAGQFEDVSLLGCMAHVRRYFHEAMELGELRYSPIVLVHIQNLYAIEQRLREKKAGPALREAVRASDSLPILRRLYKIIAHVRENTLPKAALGTALNYALNNQEAVEACFYDGRYEIDNNLTENAIRVTKLGQKNWLFVGSAEAGWVAALVYTLVENCKRNGLDPYCYLEDVLGLLPEGAPTAEDVAHLTPARLAAAKREAARTAAA